MPNVIRLTPRISMPNQSFDHRPGSCSDLTSAVSQIKEVERAWKAYLEREVGLLVRTSARAQQIIGQIEDEEIRARLSVQADSIRELGEIVLCRVAQL